MQGRMRSATRVNRGWDGPGGGGMGMVVVREEGGRGPVGGGGGGEFGEHVLCETADAGKVSRPSEKDLRRGQQQLFSNTTTLSFPFFFLFFFCRGWWWGFGSGGLGRMKNN